MPEYFDFGTFWIISEYFAIYWNILEYLKYSGILWNIVWQLRTERFFSLVDLTKLVCDGPTETEWMDREMCMLK